MWSTMSCHTLTFKLVLQQWSASQHGNWPSQPFPLPPVIPHRPAVWAARGTGQYGPLPESYPGSTNTALPVTPLTGQWHEKNITKKEESH